MFCRLSAVILFALLFVNTASAHLNDKEIELYALDCGDTFACPTSLQGRVSFWVDVFSRWDTNTAVFHDKEVPQRVFSTLSRNDGCRHSKKGDAISRQRDYLKTLIRATANRVEKGRRLNNAQSKIAKIFEGQTVNEMRRSAGRIRCQSGNKDRMREALQVFNQYRPTIISALQSENLTTELQYLPFVESAFNPNALSHVGAAGLWQIMPSTGRTLGLTVNNALDERYDPIEATYAAAKYFRNSTDKLSAVAKAKNLTITSSNLTPFIITSYNYGIRGMERAIQKVGLDYEGLLIKYKSPSFQTAVKNFYASFLAARHVAKNEASFFADLQDQKSPLPAFEHVSLTRATSTKRIVSSLNVDEKTLKQLNPAIRKQVWRGKALVPKNYRLKLPKKDQAWAYSIANMNDLPKEYERPGYVWHRVKRGETACGIARKYKTSCKKLWRANHLNKKGTVYVGKRIKVPTKRGGIGVRHASKSSKNKPVAKKLKSVPVQAAAAAPQKLVNLPAVASNAPVANVTSTDDYNSLIKNTSKNSSKKSSVRSSKSGRYTVKKGDSACKIASRHKLSCDGFLRHNGLTKRSTLQVGQRLSLGSKSSKSTRSRTKAWHTVRRGQTACAIAATYRVRCNSLLSVNKLSRRSTIKVGQRLRIPRRG